MSPATETVQLDILGLNVQPEKPPPKQERAPDGTFVKPAEKPKAKSKREIFDELVPPSADEIAQAKATVETAAKAETPASTPTPEGSKPSEARTAALKVLELDGWEASDLESLSDERATALAAKAKKRQVEISKKLEAKAKQEKREATGQEKPSERGPAEPTRQPIDFNALVKPIAKSLALSDDEGDALASIFQKGREDLEQEVRSLREELTGLRASRLTEEIANVRKELSGRFPKLSEDDEFEAALEEANELAVGLRASGRGNSLRDVFEAVARIRYFDDAKPAEPQSSEDVRKKRDEGQPVNGSRTTQPRALTTEQKKRRYFDALQDGEDAEAARRRIYGG